MAAPDCQHWAWAARWFGDIVCEPRDKIGFVIGLVSVALWALAEVPQLVVNFLEGSSEGLSEGLLWLWVFSDILDVAGCSISDTLPTMLITAWMYLIFTILLLLQHIYYTRVRSAGPEPVKVASERERLLVYESDEDLITDLLDPTFRHHRGTHDGAPGSDGKHTVYGSLRNLSLHRTSSSNSLSFTDTGRRLHDSFIRRKSHHRALAPAVFAGPERPPTADAATIRSLRTASLPATNIGNSHTSKILAGVAVMALLGVGSCAAGSTGGSGVRRSLLAEGNVPVAGEFLGISYAVWGAIMGWMMAATFFLGRVPQVIKNWQRKSCAGLSVEMFLVVFSAAVTYCASILIRVRSWSDLVPKLPFFTDAAVGALVDLIILAQFLLYKNTEEQSTAATSTYADSGKHCSPPESTAGRDRASSSHSANSSSNNKSLADLPADKLAALTRLLALQQTDVQQQQQQQDVGTRNCVQDSNLGQVAPHGVGDMGHHIDILVIDHSDDTPADLLSGSSWNDDALSALSVATV